MLLQEVKINEADLPSLRNSLRGWIAIFNLPTSEKPIVLEYDMDPNHSVITHTCSTHLIPYPCQVPTSEKRELAKAGVAILINKSPAFHWCSDAHIYYDKYGRYVQTQIQTNNGTQYTICNIHCHNNPVNRGEQLHALHNTLTHSPNVILGGDFNSVINPLMDTSHPLADVNTGMANENARAKEQELYAKAGLIDAFRQIHPDDKIFSRPHIPKIDSEGQWAQTARRLDRLYIHNNIEQQLVFAQYHDNWDLRSSQSQNPPYL